MKTCPNCGKKVDSNSKFCTYCGYNFSSLDNNEFKKQSSRRVEKSSSSSGYFNWLLNSIKRPTTTSAPIKKHWGLLSLGLSLILGIVLVIAYIQSGINSAIGIADSYGVGSFAQSISESNDAFKDIFLLVIYCIIWFALLLAIISVTPYATKRILYGSDERFNTYLNNYGAYSNSVLLLEVISILLVLLRVDILATLVLIFVPLIYMVAFYVIILSDKRPARHDKVYTMIIALIVYSILLVFSYIIFGSLIFSIFG